MSNTRAERLARNLRMMRLPRGYNQELLAEAAKHLVAQAATIRRLRAENESERVEGWVLLNEKGDLASKQLYINQPSKVNVKHPGAVREVPATLIYGTPRGVGDER